MSAFCRCGLYNIEFWNQWNQRGNVWFIVLVVGLWRLGLFGIVLIGVGIWWYASCWSWGHPASSTVFCEHSYSLTQQASSAVSFVHYYSLRPVHLLHSLMCTFLQPEAILPPAQSPVYSLTVWGHEAQCWVWVGPGTQEPDPLEKYLSEPDPEPPENPVLELNQKQLEAQRHFYIL